MEKILNTKFYSKRTGKICEGCRRCVKGEKLVLFVTGICPRNCWYCPLSEKKQKKDVIYANEFKIDSFDDIITEAKLTDAKGAGITGGDPLAKLSRTCEIIRKLKSEFDDFHIHLYTSLDLFDEKSLQKLIDAGLDEIRLHPDVEDSKLWGKMEILKNFPITSGIEIPVIPDHEIKIKELIDLVTPIVDFINLNELEITETNREKFLRRRLRTTGYISQSIRGSKETAEKILNYCLKKGKRCHFCTAKTKDAAQLKNRIKRRAKNVATEFDEITSEGLLVRPVIYGNQRLKEFLDTHEIPYVMDPGQKRAIVDPYSMKENLELIKESGFKPAIVEEYPTWDATKIQVDYI